MNVITALIFVAALFCSYRAIIEIILSLVIRRDCETPWLAFIACILWGLFYYLAL